MFKETMANQDAASSFTSEAMHLQDNQCIYVQAEFTDGGSDVAGTMRLQTSATGDEASYVDVRKSDGSIATVTTTGSATCAIDFIPTAAAYVRAGWAYDSGTGTITITGFSKDFSMVTRSAPAIAG